MAHEYIKESETFNTLRNGTVPKPTAQEVSDGKVLGASGVWVEQSGGGSVNYSETEHRIGTWVDGKPLYEKTIVKSNIDIGYDAQVHTQIAHNISALKEAVDLCIACPALGIVAKDTIFYQTSLVCLFHIDSTYITAVSGTDYYGGTLDRVWYFTMRYTKITD